MNAEHFFHRRPRKRRFARLVDRPDDHRNGRELTQAIGARENAVAEGRLAEQELARLRSQHQMREIDVPRVWRNVRALGHVAKVAEIALVDDLGEIALRDVAHLAALRGVDEIEQRRKCIAQAHAAPAAVADLEDPLELAIERSLVVEIGAAPIDRMPDRRVETAFAVSHVALMTPGERFARVGRSERAFRELSGARQRVRSNSRSCPVTPISRCECAARVPA
jgi:hypothetical protein